MAVCLVTGAAGFIGSHLVEKLLQDHHSVIGVDSFTSFYSPEKKRENVSTALANPNYLLLEKDLEDFTISICPALPEYVFHLAGQPGVRESWNSNYIDYVRRNVAATQSLLNEMRSRPPRRFVLASSSSVYGVCESYPVSETQPAHPISPYGVSKLAAENLCFAYSREFSLSSVVLRFFTAYGPRQRPDMAVYRFLETAYAGKPLQVNGSGEDERDYTFVEDVVDACVSAMHLDANYDYEVLNIGSGNPISLASCLDVIDGVMGRESVRQHRERQPGDPTKTHADIAKARSLLGFSPKWIFREGVKKQWDWQYARLKSASTFRQAAS